MRETTYDVVWIASRRRRASGRGRVPRGGVVGAGTSSRASHARKVEEEAHSSLEAQAQKDASKIQVIARIV